MSWEDGAARGGGGGTAAEGGYKEQIVRFEVRHGCAHGDAVLVSGSAGPLGSWDPERALPLEWSEGDVWRGDARLPPGEEFHFKLLLRRRDGGLEWPPGDDCELTPPCYRRTYTTLVRASWGGPAEVVGPFARRSAGAAGAATATDTASEAEMRRVGVEVEAKVRRAQEAVDAVVAGGEGAEELQEHVAGLADLLESFRALGKGESGGEGALAQKSRAVEQALASLNSEVLEQESALEEAGGDPLSPAALAADVAIAGHARTTMLALAELEAAGRQLQAGGPANDAP